MDLFGIGLLELLVVLVVALMVLGPKKTVHMARSAGKMLGEVRRAMGDLSRAIDEEEWETGSEASGAEEPELEGGDPPEERR